MRSRALILALALAGLVCAPGQAARRLPAQAAPTAQASGLRGPVDDTSASPTAGPVAIYSPLTNGAVPAATATPVPSKMSLAPALGVSGTAATVAVADTSDCRMSCARSYYFCAAGDDAESCSPTWTQCLATCRQSQDPSPGPSASLAPPTP